MISITKLSDIFINKTKDIIWMVDSNYNLIYANRTYLSLKKDSEVKLNNNDLNVFFDGFSEEVVQKWKAYFNRAMNGEYFEIEEDFSFLFNKKSKYFHVIIQPVLEENGVITSIACQARDITKIVKQRSQAKQLINASLDVFCSINEDGYFEVVSEAATIHWGYTPNELLKIPYRSLILEDDVPLTDTIAAEIISGKDTKSFSNRYRRKDGSIAYNLWSARWDAETKLMYCVARDGREYLEKEEIILQSEQRFKALVQDGADMISIIDTNGKYNYTSPNTLAILGISPKEFQGNTIFDFIHPEDIERATGYMQKISSQKKIIVEPFRLRNANNEWRWIETVLTNLMDNPAVKGIVANSRDITENIKREESIRQSQKRFESLVENSLDCVIIISPESKTTFVSGSVKNILGYLPEEVMDIDIKTLIHPEDIIGLENALMSIMNNPGVPMPGYTSRVKHKNGSWRWIEAVITNLIDDPAVQGIVDNFRDVTDKIEDDRKRKLLESVITNTNDAVLITEAEPFDEPGPKIIYVNDAFTKMTGYTAEEVIGKTPRILQGPNSNKAELSRLSKALRNWESCEITTINYKKNGEEFWINLTVTPVADEEGWYTHWIAIERDVTEEKKLKELHRQIRQLAKIGTWELNLLNQKLYWSEEVHQLHETDPNFYIPDLESSINFYREDFRDIVKSSIDTAKATGEPFDFEAVIITLNGKEVWIRSIGNVEFIDEKSKRIYGSFQDINDYKIAELSVIESETKFRTIFDIATLGIAQVNPLNGKVILANSYYETITGFSTDELLKMSFLELTHPDDQDQDWKLFSKAANEGSEYRNEKRYVKKDGTIVWVRLHVAFIRDKMGKPIKTVAICEDITERKEAESRLQNISNNIPGVVFQYIMHPNGTDELRNVSKGSEKIWSYSPEEVSKNIDLVWNQTKAGGQYEIVKQSIIDSVKNKTQWSIYYPIITPTGEKRILHGLGTPEFLADGTVLYNSVVLDITQEAKNQELLDDVIRLTGIGSWEVDVINNSVFWSNEVHRIYQTDPSSFKPSIDVAINFYREDYRDLAQSSFEQCMITGDSYDIEAVVITANKKEVWVRTTAKAEIIDGVCTRVYGSFQDINERKESELRLKSITDDLPGVSFQYMITPDGKDFMQSVSKAALDVWKVNSKDCELNNELVWDQIKKGGDFEAVQQSIQESITNNKKWNFQWRNILPDGDLRWHEGYGTPNLLADGTVVFNSLIFDITDKNKALELYNEASKMARIGSWELDLVNQGTDAMYWSPMTREILECDEDYNPSLSGGFEFYTEESRDIIQNAVTLLINEGKQFDEDLLIVTAKGNDCWIRCIGKCVRVNNKCTKIYGSFQDIHNSKTLAVKIREILGSISDAFYAIDTKWCFTYFNKEAERLLLRFEYEVIGKNIWEVFPAAIGTPLEELYSKVFKSKKSSSIEYLYPGDDNWYEVNVYPAKEGISVYFKNITEKRESAEKLLKALEEKNTILESISDNFYALDREFNFTYMNTSCADLLNVDRQSIIGKNLFEEFQDLKSTVFEQELLTVKKNLKTSKFEFYYPSFDAWFYENIYATPDGYSIYFIDITKKKIAEIKVQESNELLKKAYTEKYNILESIGDAFFTLNREWLFTYCNEKVSNFLGRSRDQIIGKHFFDEFPEIENSTFFNKYKHALNTGEVVRFEEKQNSLGKWFEVSVYPSNEGLSVYFTDITLRKEADIRLIQANERFEKVTQATSDVIWDWDIVNDTFYRSQNSEKFFGKSSVKVFKSKDFWKDSFDSSDLEDIKNSLFEALNNPNENRWEAAYRVYNSSKEVIYIIDKGLIIRDSRGKAIRMIGAMSDITKSKVQERELLLLNESLKKYTKELERSNEELEQFAFITSHDLQEPLRMISSFMEQLRKKYGDQLDEKALSYIQFATDGAKRMKQIILDLLEYSRAGRSIDSMDKVNIGDVIDNFKQLRNKVISEKSVTITTFGLPTIYSFNSALTQIFHSLLDNAIKYSKEGLSPKIEINAIDCNVEWKFSIKDNGIGISSEFYDKIFVIFQRLHNQNEFDGTGIGLSITKKYVEFLGGKIWVESVLGEGSTFFFTVPKKEKSKNSDY